MNDIIAQGSPEWHAQRVGKVTASRVADIVRRTKSGFSTSRANLMAELIAERLTGIPAESFKSAAMQWGTDTESAARAAYELIYDCDIELAGFVDHPTIPQAGASPDGFVSADGLVEFKCPLTATHLDTLLGSSIPNDYLIQVQWQMACRPERKWCDWVSFDPRMPAAMQMYRHRVLRDNAQIAELEKAVVEFQFEMDVKLTKLRDRFDARSAAA